MPLSTLDATVMSESIETNNAVISSLADEKLQKLIDLIEIKVQTANGEQTINLLEKISDSLQFLSNLFYLFFVISILVLILSVIWSLLCTFIDDPYDNYKPYGSSYYDFD